MKKNLIFISFAFVFLLAGFASEVSAAVFDDIGLYYNFNSRSELVNGVYNLTANQGTPVYNSTSCLIGNCTQIGTDRNIYIPRNNFTALNSTYAINFWARFNSATPPISDEYVFLSFLGSSSATGRASIYDSNTWLFNSLTAPSNTLSTKTSPSAGNYFMFTINRESNGNVSIYINGVLGISGTTGVMNNTGYNQLLLGTNAINNASDMLGQIDELGVWSRSLTAQDISDLYNGGAGISFEDSRVALNYPEDAATFSESFTNFTATLNPISGTNNTNATIFVWHSNGTLFNSTLNFVSGNVANTTRWNISGFSIGNYEWNVLGCFSDGQCTFAGRNYTLQARPFTVINRTYNANVSETSSQLFAINIETIDDILSATASLVYNGTTYPAESSCSPPFCTFEVTIDIPLVSSGSSQNKEFYWAIDVFDGSSVIEFSDSVQTQNVSRIYLQSCDGSVTNKALNFTAYNEQNKTRISPFNFQGNFNYYLGAGRTYRTLSVSNSTIDEVNLCISPNSTYYIDSIIAYSAPNSTTTYPTRNYFFQKSPITNNSQKIPLYLLKSDSSTSFVLQVQDEKNIPVPGVLVNAQRCYVGEDTNETAFISRTDSNGLTVGNFEAETALYKFFITNQSNVLLAIDTCSKIVPQTTPYTLLFQIGGGYVSPFLNINNVSNIQSTLFYNKTAGSVTWQYIDTSSTFINASMIIRSLNYSGSDSPIVCSQSSVLSSAILTCNVSDSGTYSARVYVYRTDERLIDQLVFTVEDFASTVGYYGAFLTFFLIVVSAFAFKWNEIAGIWMVNATVIFVNYIGLWNVGPVFITAMIAVSIIITGVLER